MHFMNSLRGRLSVWLLLAAMLTAAVIGLLTYRETLEQNKRLIDYQLRQTALSLRDQGTVAEWEPDFISDDENDVVVQIWTANGNVMYLSHPGMALPDRAVMGFTNVEANGKQWRVFSMLGRNRIIQVAQPYHIRHDLATNAALRSLGPLIAFSPLMALLIWLLIGGALRPLKRLEREVIERDARSLSPVSEQGLPSEIAPVVHALNSLLGRLKEAFAGQRAFVADAAHELRSPLTALKLQLRLLATAQNDEDRNLAMRKLNEGVDRSTRLIEQLLTAARTEVGDTTFSEERVDLAETMRRVIAEVFATAQSRDINIEMEAPDHVYILGDAAQLYIMLRNLLDNAVQNTPRSGTVQAKIEVQGEHTCLYVDDNGPGIPLEERKSVFRRFYRGQSATQGGNGLGLAIVKNIVTQHHGTIKLGDSPLGGLQVYVCFNNHEKRPVGVAG
jgi:signal transduction histidine kinase